MASMNNTHASRGSHDLLQRVERAEIDGGAEELAVLSAFDGQDRSRLA